MFFKTFLSVKNVSRHKQLLLSLKQRACFKWARSATNSRTRISEQTIELVEEQYKNTHGYHQK